MKTETVTLTQQPSNTYAREGVIFMAQPDASKDITGKNEPGNEQKQDTQETEQSQQHKENPEVARKAHERAQALRNELQAKLAEVANGKPIPDDADALSQLLEENSRKITPEQIHKWLEKFSKLLDDGDLRSSPTLRKLRRQYKKIEETLMKLDPQADEIIQGKTGTFDEQLLTQFGEYLGVKVKPDLAEGMRVDTTSDGVETLHVAENIPLEKLVEIARQLHPEQFTSESQSNMVQFGRDLQRAAVWMNEHQNDGLVFSPDLMRRLYKQGAQLEAAKQVDLSNSEIDRRIFQAAHDPNFDPQQRGFMNIIMGRHILSSEVTRDNLYDVYFRRWEQRQVAKLVEESGELERDEEYQSWQKELSAFSEKINALQDGGGELSADEKAQRDRLLELSSQRRKTVTEKYEREFKEASLPERQRLYDEYLAKSGTQENLARWVKRFIEKAEISGRLGRLGARAVESKLQQDMLQAMVGKWQEAMDKTEGAQLMKEHIQEELNRALAVKKQEAREYAQREEDVKLTSEEQLRIVTEFFQPQNGKPADALKYIPAEILDLFGKNDEQRNLAACAIVAGYEMHVLQSIEGLDVKVTSNLSGAHATLWVVGSNGEVFEVDPSASFNPETQKRGENKGVQKLLQDTDERKRFAQDLKEFLGNGQKEAAKRLFVNGKWHVIGGEALITSELLGNLAALKVKDESSQEEDRKIWYLKKMLPKATPVEIQELQFALAKKAVDMVPDNYVAWAQMGKFATDGRREEYHDYAIALNKDGVLAAENKDLLVGDGSIEQITMYRFGVTGAGGGTPYGEHYPNPDERISKAISEFTAGNTDRALELIEALINRDRANHRSEQYTAVINNILYDIQEKIDAANTAGDPQEAERWHHLARFTFEYSIEQIIGKNDHYPRTDWQQPSDLYTQASMATIGQLASQFDADYGRGGNPQLSNSQYLVQLQSMRSNAHTIFKNITNKKYFKEGVVSALQEQGLDFLEQQVAGVKTVQRMYEKVFYEQSALLGHWPTEKEVREYADRKIQGDKDTNTPGLIGSMDEVDEVTGFKLRSWQVLRAGVVGMQLSALSQRRMTLSVTGDPPNLIPDLVAGLPGEGNLTGLAGALKMTMARYFFEPNARAYIDSIVEAYRHRGPRGRQYGLIMGGELILNEADKKNAQGQTIKNPRWKGLWGQSEMSYAMMDSGSQDPKSMKWAAEFMYLGRQDYQNYTITAADLPDGYVQQYGSQEIDKPMNLKLYLDIQLRIAKLQATDAKNEDEVRAIFNRNIQGMVREQRLFLGALSHYEYNVVGESPLNDETRAIIWDKVAELMPSKIASMLPKEARNIMAQRMFRQNMYAPDGSTLLTVNQMQDLEAAWDKLLDKLWKAEDRRVKEDAILLRTNPDGTPLSNTEKYRLLKQLDATRWGGTPPRRLDSEPNLDAYLALQNIIPKANQRDPDGDYEVIQEIMRLGKRYVGQNADGTPMAGWETGNRRGEFAGGLARMTFIFTPFLDDAPDTRWSNLTPDILERLLVYTQDDFDKANTALISIAGNPVKKPQDLKEPFQNALKGLESPLGTYDSQIMLEPWATGYLDLASETEVGKVLGLIIKPAKGKFFGLARSKLEKHNTEANIALAESEIADFLGGLAQDQIINSDNDKKNAWGRTMYQELRKKYKADLLANIMGFLRLFTMLFGAAVGWELLKAFLPEDVGKQLG